MSIIKFWNRKVEIRLFMGYIVLFGLNALALIFLISQLIGFRDLTQNVQGQYIAEIAAANAISEQLALAESGVMAYYNDPTDRHAYVQTVQNLNAADNALEEALAIIQNPSSANQIAELAAIYDEFRPSFFTLRMAMSARDEILSNLSITEAGATTNALRLLETQGHEEMTEEAAESARRYISTFLGVNRTVQEYVRTRIEIRSVPVQIESALAGIRRLDFEDSQLARYVNTIVINTEQYSTFLDDLVARIDEIQGQVTAVHDQSTTMRELASSIVETTRESIQLRIQDLQQQMTQSLIVVAVVLLISFAAMVFLFYELRARVVGPLVALSSAAGAMAAGEFSRRVPVRGEDEIAELSASFNEMAENLESLIAETTRLSTVVQKAPDGIALAGGDLSIVYTNPQFHEMVGDAPADDMPGQFTSPDAVRERLEALLTEDHAVQGEYDLKTEAEPLPVLVSFFPVMLNSSEATNGTERGVGMIVHDITNRREMVRDLQVALDTIRDLSIPVIPIFEGILVAPIVGQIDEARGDDILGTVLRQIEERDARTLLIDITGLAEIDTGAAMNLFRTVNAARLLGCEVVLAGIRPDLAEMMVTLQIDTGRLRTFGDLQSALEYALARAGKRFA